MRLLPAAGCAWVAGAVTTAFPGSALPLALALWAVVVVLLGAALVLRRHPAGGGLVAPLALALAAAALVTGIVAGTAPLRSPPQLVGDESTRHGEVMVRIDSFVEERSGGAVPADAAEGVPVRFSGTLHTFERADGVVSAAVPVTVLASVDDPRAHPIGETLRFDADLVAPRPGDVRPALLVGAGAVEVAESPPWWLAWAATVRSAFTTVADGLPGDGGALLTGLVVGDDSELPGDLGDAMLATGLTHLTAVSGANCAIVVGMGVVLAAALGAGLRVRLVVGGALLVLFVVLVTPQASVLRAAAMAVIVLVATASGRSRAGLPALALGAIVLLVVDSRLAVSAGFALSVAATAGLLLLARPIGRLLARAMPDRIAEIVAIPLAAQLACQPILFVLDPTIALYAVPANLLAEPAAAFTTVTGSIVCVLAPLAPSVAAVVAWVPWLGSAWIAAVARFFTGLPGAVVEPTGDPVVLAAVVGMCCAVTIAGLLVIGARRRLGAVLISAVVIVVLGAVAVGAGRSVARSTSVPADWVVAACDIGQGDALLVRSAGRTALIDAGPDPEPLAECLEETGVRRLDLVVLTHYDHDHVGGAAAVLGMAEEVLVGPDPSGRGERLRESLEAGGARIVAASRGMHGALGDFRWDVLWPRAGGHAEGNEASVTVLFAGPLRMLFLGDLGEAAQDGVLAAGALPEVDVVKVSHHGSADQSEALYREIGATIGLISVGADNDYGHPTSRLLDILERSRTEAFRTDLDGLVLVEPQASGLQVWTERGPPESQVDGRLQRPSSTTSSSTGP